MEFREEEDLLSEVGVEAIEETGGGVLRAISLTGSQLFGTNIFQQLRTRDFFITSLTWRSRLEGTGNPVVEFNAEFDDSENCRLFRYSANAWRIRRVTCEYHESFTPIPPAEKLKLLEELYAHAAACAKGIGIKPVSVEPIDPDLSGEKT